MTTNTAIMMKGVAPAPAGAPPAACAIASGINEFMGLSHASQKNGAANSGAGAYFGRKINLCHRDLRLARRRGRVGGVTANYFVERSRFDAGAQLAHELEVVV